MKQSIKQFLYKHRLLVSMAVFGVVCLLFALLRVEVGLAFIFVWAADLVRLCGNNLFGYLAYISIACLPLIYPLVLFIKTKRLRVFYLLWLALSIFLFFALYFFINPHRVRSDIILLGFALTAYLFVFLAITLQMMAGAQESRLHFYAKAVLVGIIFVLIFSVLYAELFALCNQIREFSAGDIRDFGYSPALNTFVMLTVFLLKTAPVAVMVLLLLSGVDLVGRLKKEMFSPLIIPRVKRIARLCALNILVSLLAMIVQNLLLLLLHNKLIYVQFLAVLPIGMVLFSLLVLIFAKVMLSAVRLSEDNKLVI